MKNLSLIVVFLMGCGADITVCEESANLQAEVAQEMCADYPLCCACECMMRGLRVDQEDPCSCFDFFGAKNCSDMFAGSAQSYLGDSKKMEEETGLQIDWRCLGDY